MEPSELGEAGVSRPAQLPLAQAAWMALFHGAQPFLSSPLAGGSEPRGLLARCESRSLLFLHPEPSAACRELCCAG